MDRRRVLLTSLVGALAGPLAAGAQQAGKLPTIGFLGPPPSAGGLVQAFQPGLRELGYVEGQNIRIEYRYTDIALQGHTDLLPRLAEELVRLKPDVLVVSVTEAALAAKNATRTISIVMVSVPDPVAAGLVANLARPGGNVTRLSRQTRDLIGKTLQLLREALPQTVRVDLLANPTEPLSATMVADAKEAAKLLGVQLKIVEVRAPADLEGAFVTMRADGAGALLVVSGAGFYLNRAQIVRLAFRDRLPSVFQNREFVEAGGLLSYAPSTAANYQRAAVFVDKILKGAKPGDLPVEQPTKFELIINLKTAKARPHDPAFAAGAGGSGDRMKRKASKPRSEPRSTDGTRSLLPMEIQIGDRLTDAGFEWEVVTHPAALHGGKSLRTGIQRPGLPETERDMTWPAHVRIKISRGSKPSPGSLDPLGSAWNG